jgi:hypothetical protein
MRIAQCKTRVYYLCMNYQDTTPQKPKKKTGPKPQGYVRFQLLLSPADWEWAKDQPDGASACIRRLLREARARQDESHGYRVSTTSSA